MKYIVTEELDARSGNGKTGPKSAAASVKATRRKAGAKKAAATKAAKKPTMAEARKAYKKATGGKRIAPGINHHQQERVKKARNAVKGKDAKNKAESATLRKIMAEKKAAAVSGKKTTGNKTGKKAHALKGRSKSAAHKAKIAAGVRAYHAAKKKGKSKVASLSTGYAKGAVKRQTGKDGKTGVSAKPAHKGTKTLPTSKTTKRAAKKETTANKKATKAAVRNGKKTKIAVKKVTSQPKKGASGKTPTASAKFLATVKSKLANAKSPKEKAAYKKVFKALGVM